MDLLKRFRSGYQPPSRDKLAGIMLSHAVIKIENKIKAIFEKSTNLTLGMVIIFLIQ